MNFRQTLKTEFEQRRQRNPRYSLRAFARYLGTDHSTLSQIIRRRRSLSPRMIHHLGRRLRIKPSVLAEACAQEHGEAILRLAKSKSFRTNSRWIAVQTGIPLDAVNVTLHRLLYHGDLVMESANRWTLTRLPYA